MSFIFVLNSILLGVGLAMDAFSVSLANGLNEPNMRKSRMGMIAFVYAFFQFAMPMIGWFCVHEILSYFQKFQPFIPWIALILLLYIGGKMLIEGIRGDSDEGNDTKSLSLGVLLIQGVATSIDALSVGFTIAEYNTLLAFSASAIIAVVTFIICVAGLILGKLFGTKLAGKASIFGGIILICIGIEIFVTGVFF